MRTWKRDQRGQAVVEYVLSIALALSIVVILGTGFRKSLYSLWSTITGEVTAACPKCPHDPKVKLR